MRKLGRSAVVVLLSLCIAVAAHAAVESVQIAVGESVLVPFGARVTKITGVDDTVIRYFLNAADRIELKGLATGRSPLEVRLGDGTVRVFEIDVLGPGSPVAVAPLPVAVEVPGASFDVALIEEEPRPVAPPPVVAAEVVPVAPLAPVPIAVVSVAPARREAEVVPLAQLQVQAAEPVAEVVAEAAPVAVPEPSPVPVPVPVFELEVLELEPPLAPPAPAAVPAPIAVVEVVEVEIAAAPAQLSPPPPIEPRFEGTIALAEGDEQSFSLSEQGARIESSVPGVVSIERDSTGVVTLVARREGSTELTLVGGDGAATRYRIDVQAPARPAPVALPAPLPPPVVVRAAPPALPPPPAPQPTFRAEPVPVREQEVALLAFDLERDQPDYVTGRDLEKLEDSLRHEIRSAMAEQAARPVAVPVPAPAPAPVIAGPSPAELKQAMKEAIMESNRAMTPIRPPSPAPGARFEIRSEAMAVPVPPVALRPVPPPVPAPSTALPPAPIPVLTENPIVSLEDFAGGVLRIGAGRSRVLRLKANATRVAVADPAVSDVLLASPRQLLVTGKAPGVTSLIVWDSDEDPIYVTLQVTDKRVAEKQVLLKVKIAELRRQRMRDLGIDFAVLLDDDVIKGGLSIVSRSAGVAPALIPGAGGDLLGDSGALPDRANLTIMQPDRNIFGFIRALEEQGLARILAEPNLVAINGEEASFLAGGEFPVPIVSSSTAGELPTVNVEFKEFGVRLNFEPTILADDTITLRVEPEVSTLDFANGVVVSGLRIPALDTRRAETTVQMRDGQSIVIAGLIMSRKTEVETKTPWLGDAPFIGTLFRGDTISVEETELVIMITAHIVRPMPTGAIPSLPFDRVKREIIARPESLPPR